MLLSIPEYSSICSFTCQHEGILYNLHGFLEFLSRFSQKQEPIQQFHYKIFKQAAPRQTPFTTTSLKSVEMSRLPFGALARMSGMLFFSLVYVSSRLKYWSSLMICSRHLVLSKLLCSPPYSDGRILLGMCRWSDLRSLPCVRICRENKDDPQKTVSLCPSIASNDGD